MTSQRTRARMIERLRVEGIRDERVLTAIAAVPRHIFVEQAMAHRAYEDTALPLILGQTISQPYVVARMIELLHAGRDSLGKTLEIGAGCGYQAAVLAMLTREVFAVERLAPLLAKAREHLRQLKLSQVRLKHADGMGGLPRGGAVRYHHRRRRGRRYSAAAARSARSRRAADDPGRLRSAGAVPDRARPGRFRFCRVTF